MSSVLCCLHVDIPDTRKRHYLEVLCVLPMIVLIGILFPKVEVSDLCCRLQRVRHRAASYEANCDLSTWTHLSIAPLLHKPILLLGTKSDFASKIFMFWYILHCYMVQHRHKSTLFTIRNSGLVKIFSIPGRYASIRLIVWN